MDPNNNAVPRNAYVMRLRSYSQFRVGNTCYVIFAPPADRTWETDSIHIALDDSMVTEMTAELNLSAVPPNSRYAIGHAPEYPVWRYPWSRGQSMVSFKN